METGTRWPGRDWAASLAPQGMVGRPEALVFALLSALVLVLVALADISARSSLAISTIGLVPILATAWYLSRRLTVALTLIAIALRLVVWQATSGDRAAVLAQVAIVCIVALFGHVAAVFILRWRQSEARAIRLRKDSEQASQLERAKSEFLRLASHELRRPVAVLQGYLSMLEDGTLGQLSPDVKTVLPLLSGRVREINTLIEQMLETARLEDSRLQLKWEEVALDDLVRETVASLDYLAGEEHELRVSVPGGRLLVSGDANRLQTIVANLVSNAIKYSPKGGEVSVAVERMQGRACVVVRDQGVGIRSQDMDLLFTRFGRVPSTETEAVSGTGLGLYLSRELARKHGGDIVVESKPGKGSTFTLVLPPQPVRLAVEPQAGPGPALSTGQPARGRRRLAG